jgi:hypothetical protein
MSPTVNSSPGAARGEAGDGRGARARRGRRGRGTGAGEPSAWARAPGPSRRAPPPPPTFEVGLLGEDAVERLAGGGRAAGWGVLVSKVTGQSECGMVSRPSTKGARQLSAL